MAAEKKEQFSLQAVGVVRNGLEAKCRDKEQDCRSWAEKVKNHVSQVVIDPGLEGILDGIDDFSHLLVLYWPHLVAENQRRRCCRVRPMQRRDMPLKGIFATCSPVRPNPVLVTAVELVRRRANTLFVKGLDALDGSPVLDIKPYVESLYRVEKTRVPSWMAKLSANFDDQDKGV